MLSVLLSLSFLRGSLYCFAVVVVLLSILPSLSVLFLTGPLYRFCCCCFLFCFCFLFCCCCCFLCFPFSFLFKSLLPGPCYCCCFCFLFTFLFLSFLTGLRWSSEKRQKEKGEQKAKSNNSNMVQYCCDRWIGLERKTNNRELRKVAKTDRLTVGKVNRPMCQPWLRPVCQKLTP